MKLTCPACRTEIPLTDVNVSTDLALCRRCGKNFSYADLADAPNEPVELSRPPKGAWLSRNARGFEVGASLRHPVAFFLVPFMCLWSGGSLGGIYGSQIYKGQFNLEESLFGIPFLIGTIIIGAITLFVLFGKMTIRVENDQGVVFWGLGNIGWRRRFKWNEVTEIQQTVCGSSNGKPMKQITLHAGRKIGVGPIPAVRQQFVLAALRQMLRERH